MKIITFKYNKISSVIYNDENSRIATDSVDGSALLRTVSQKQQTDSLVAEDMEQSSQTTQKEFVILGSWQ